VAVAKTETGTAPLSEAPPLAQQRSAPVSGSTNRAQSDRAQSNLAQSDRAQSDLAQSDRPQSDRPQSEHRSLVERRSLALHHQQPAKSASQEAGALAAGPASGTSRSAANPTPWLIFGIVSIALFMSSLDGTIVATGLPTLRHALHSGINWAAWTMMAYQLGLVVAFPIAGRVADSVGRKRVFMGAAVLFTTSSLLCGFAVNIGMLIGLRVLQAAGGAAFMPSASGIVMESFGEHRHRALGLFSSIFPLGALVGPIFGGIILATWSWRGLFLVNVPIGLVFTLLAWRFLPSPAGQGGRPDFLGALFLGGGVLGIMLAISDAGSRAVGITSPACALPLAFSVVCGWAFMHHSARVENPIIPAHLLRGRAFAATNAVNLVWGACAIGFGSLVPLFAEDRYGLSPLASGTLLTARAVGEIMLAVFAAVLIHRTGYRVPIIFGIMLIAGGLAMIATRPEVFSPYVWLTIGAAITGLGTGLSAPAANNASIELAPDDVGSITGLRGSARQGGAIIGIALATSVAAHTGHEVRSLTQAFFVLSILLLCMVPVVFLVPDGRGHSSPAGALRTAH
jgi:EmrB/QacA subfamily drug resistance transporter